MNKPQATIYFGAMCKPLAEQLEGYELGSLCVPQAQADANAITRLYVRGYMGHAQRDKMQARLVREMKRAMKTPKKAEPLQTGPLQDSCGMVAGTVDDLGSAA